MDFSVVFAGFGGQGVLFAGRILAQAAMMSGKNVTWIPSYGPEMRGGTANCTVKISDKKVGALVVANPAVAIVMNRASFEKFAKTVRPEGLLIVNSSIVKDVVYPKGINIIEIPANAIAHELGNDSIANMVILGALIESIKIMSKEEIFLAIEEVIGKKRPQLIPLNQHAIGAGMDYIRANR